MLTATQKLNERIQKSNSLLCVGLDSELEKLPPHLAQEEFPQFAFNKAIIDATHEYVCAYKPNIAFYEAHGDKSLKELKMTMEYLQSTYPDIFTICDAKRADIGTTNAAYVRGILDWFGFDATTVQPYLGKEALQPFLDRKDKVIIILCRTSNPGAGEFQDLLVDGQPLWMRVTKSISEKWNENGNCMLVVGATYPDEMRKIREMAGDMTFLVPGIGAQGGDLEKTMRAGLNSKKEGLLISSSRSIIFASTGQDFAEVARREAQKLRDDINIYR
jgi:orotidine-5'-phosphate decarboxylase